MYYGGDFEEVVPIDTDENTVTVDELPNVLTVEQKRELKSLLNTTASTEEEIIRNFLIAEAFVLESVLLS